MYFFLFFTSSNCCKSGLNSDWWCFLEYHNVSVYAPAVAQIEDGYEGVISTITVTIQNNPKMFFYQLVPPLDLSGFLVFLIVFAIGS